MKFLIDENVRHEVIQFIKDLGYDITIAPRASSDKEIAKIAQDEGRVILTHDIHFASILEYPPDEYPGIIRIRIHPPSVKIIIGALENLLKKLAPSKINNKLVILEKDGFRVRE